MFRFLGVMGDSQRTPPEAGETLLVKRFDSGFLAVDRRARIHEENREIFIAFGDPHFAGKPGTGDACAPGDLYRAFKDNAPETLSRMRGRYVCVLLGMDEQRVQIATDRFATFPLCYSLEHGFAFSDRADAVPRSAGAISSQAVFDYLYFHVIPGPVTIFQNVRRAAPGQHLVWDGKELGARDYWRPVFSENARPGFEQRKREFLGIVEDAVRRQSASECPAAFLSGGTDSSTVAGMLTRVLGTGARTYSIGFDASGYDEMSYARIAAKHFGTDHHEYYVTPEDLLTGIPRVATHYDQPFGNSSAVPALVCAERAKNDGVDKMLAGDGGDELFGGNTRYAKQRVFGWYHGVPGIIRRGLLEPVFLGSPVGRLPLLKKGASYIRQASIPMPDRLETYNLLRRIGVARVVDRRLLDSIDEDEPEAMQRDTWAGIQTASELNKMLAFDWKYTLTDNDLPKVIGTTQLAGLDVDFPLLSDELLEFSSRLPARWKLRGLKLRWFFKRALREFLPVEIIEKKKHGFGLPFGVWACRHQGLLTLARDTLGSVADRGVIRADFVGELLDEHLPAYPGYYGELVWILMMLELWLRERAPSWRL